MATHAIVLRIYFDNRITNFDKIVEDVRKNVVGVKEVVVREKY